MGFRIFAVAFAATALLPAQRTTSTLYGNALDPSQSAVAGATLKIANELTGATWETTSNERGEFTFSFIPPGRYTVEARANGFKLFSRSSLTLGAGEQVRLPITLEIGALTEQITVSGEAAPLQDASPTLNERISRLQLSELPQSRRDFTQLLALQNGIRTPGQGLFSFNGLASGGSNVTVDGVDGAGDVETPSTGLFNGFNFINVLSQEAISEVSVSKGVYSAEVGRTFGGNINVITRGGTNQLHGSLFENWQNDVLNARNALLAPTAIKPPVRFHQFGGSLGGPVIRNRLFFFGTYEGYRQRSFRLLAATVPTPELKAQAIAAVPDYRRILDLYPNPTDPYAAGSVTGVFRGTGSNTASDNHAVARVDYRISDPYQLAVRYRRGRPGQVIPAVPLANARSFIGVTESGSVTLTTARTGWTSETRFGINLNDADRRDGLHSNGLIPTVAIQGAFSAGAETLINRGHSWSIEQVWVRSIGRHVLKLGGIYFDRNPRRFDEEVPIFTYQNAAALLANRPTNVQVTFGQPPYLGHCWETGFFVQDDFRFRPRLIFNLGLRHEYFSVYVDKSGHFFNPDGPAGAVTVPARFRSRGNAYEADRNNFSPRLGFAWTVDSANRNVIRAGIGFAYAPMNLRTFASSHYLNPDLPFRFNFAPADITALNLRYPLTNEQVANFVIGRPVPRAYVTTYPKIQNPYNVQWTFDYQRQLTPSLTVQTGYVGNKALKVSMTHNMNVPDFVTGIRPFPGTLQFTYRDDADFSYYHAWQTSIRKRLTEGFTVNAHYTWSKAIALAGGDFWLGADYRVQDETNWRSDIGPIPLDVTDRFVSDFVYELPAGRWLGLDGALKHLTGGWRFSGILSINTGQPINVVQASNRPSSRPDYNGAAPYASVPDRFAWLDRNAFVQLPVNQASGATVRPGNLGKNALRGPDQFNVDFSIAKNFRLAEGWELQVRADAFNALNNVILGSPILDVRNASFGRILGVGEARRMQLNARLTF
jgi:hypothetical protein